MESIADLLGKKDFKPPDEVALIKDYVKRKYNSPCSVKLQGGNLVLSVRNSALAGTIQLEKQKLIEACQINDKKLIIRTGY
jgi:hypothetical protein